MTPELSSAAEESRVRRRGEEQQRSLRAGRDFRDTHHYEMLHVEPSINTDGPNATPLIQVWFVAALADPEKVDAYLQQLDRLIRDAR